jgi:hypothetical protein
MVVINGQRNLQERLPVRARPTTDSGEVNIRLVNAADTASIVLGGPQSVVLLGCNPVRGPEIRTPDLGRTLIESACSLVASHTQWVRPAKPDHPFAWFESTAPIDGRAANQFRIRNALLQQRDRQSAVVTGNPPYSNPPYSN